MESICSKENCTGCGACYSSCSHSAISMRESKEGFLYPKIDPSLCVDCGLCSKVCPENSPTQRNPEPKVYAAWNLDYQIRKNSTSGGMFLSLAEYVIEHGGVVFGAVWKDTVQVVHTYAETLEDLRPMQGSKYFQSELGDAYRQVLRFLSNGRLVLFTGTPCQIGGLKNFLGKRSIDSLLTVEIICHGVPSKFAFKSYAEKLQKKYGVIDHNSFSFRMTDKGWGYETRARISGKTKSMWGIDDVFMKLFQNCYLLRESCFRCQYANKKRCADITIGDFWGIGKKNPFRSEVQLGCSVILVNSIKGKTFLDNISNSLFLEERTWEEASLENTNLREPSPRPEGRDEAYRYISKYSLDRTYYHFYSTRTAYFRHQVGRLLRFVMKVIKQK